MQICQDLIPILAEVNGNCKIDFKWGKEQMHDAKVKNEKTLLFDQQCFLLSWTHLDLQSSTA